MNMTEPTLSEVHADLVGRLKHDERLRDLETRQARVETAITEIPRMEARLIAAIQELKPKSPWPAVSAIAGVVAVFLVVAAVLYGQ